MEPNSEKNEYEWGQDTSSSENFIGRSESFNSILDTVKAIANRKSSVIIVGETGTGKEMLAREVHKYSDRCDNVFVPVDCTTLTGQLFESQLYGHVKGAFTGAVSDTLGFFRAADKGTIFLDEIGEIPLELQAKLLRVLQEERVTPVGTTKSYPVNVRVLCATNRDLSKMVKEGKFRADLYYRLNVVSVEIPPLRERKDDIMLLAEYFLENQAEFYDEPAKNLDENCKEILLRYTWPGNVRELANAMERAYVLTQGKTITIESLPREILMAEYTEPSSTGVGLPTLAEAKAKLVADALKATGGKKIAAAKILGVERRKLNRLIDSLNVSVEKAKNSQGA